MPRSNKKAKAGGPPPPSSMRRPPSSMPSMPSSSSSASGSSSIRPPPSRKERKATQASRPKIAVPPPVYRVQDSDDESSDVEEGQVRSAVNERSARMNRSRNESMQSISSPLPRKPSFTRPGADPSAMTSNRSPGVLLSRPPPFSTPSGSPYQRQPPQQYQIRPQAYPPPPHQVPSPSLPPRPQNSMQLSPSSSTSAPRWTSGEKAEAMKLIKEITALGLDPAQLVQAGIRQEIVAFCCNELRLPFSYQGENGVSGNGPTGQMSTAQAGPSSNALPNGSTDGVRRQGKQAKRPKSASAASQTAASTQVGLAAEVPNLPPSESPSSALRSAPLLPPNLAAQEILMPPVMVSPDMEAMRRAALASMKRKKAAAEEKGQQSGADDLAADDNPEVETIPTDAPFIDIPSGPKAAKPVYHDIDAPPAQSLEDIDGMQDLMMEGDVSNSSISMDTITRSADPRESKRSKLLSYADNFSGDMDAPIVVIVSS